IYRGLFNLYRLDNHVTKSIDLLDAAFAAADDASAKADDRETAQARVRAMLAVLRTDPVLVEALLGEARNELTRTRKVNTWAGLGKFDEALVHADKAVRLTSDDRKVAQRCRRAEILAQAGRFADAVKECEETLKEFTGTAQVIEIRYTLSNVYSQQGNHAKSE